ncbi:MAG: thiamine pyrophosphate-binding protein [Pseudomonadota bacterium]
MRTGGELLVAALEAQGVDRIFCVPGESYLAVLDAFHDSPIQTVVARQEGGAAMMAEADGKLTGRPGICFVTRGPGATNAASGVHVAQQDSTPMVLFIGQIGRRMTGRDAFQEVDYRQMFGGMAKWVAEIDHADRVPEVASHAFHVALAGRPGPVVVSLPEDMLRDRAEAVIGAQAEAGVSAPDTASVAHVEAALRAAKRPFVVAGGSRWDEDSVAGLKAFAERWNLPVGCSFRRQHLFDTEHPNYAGDVGLGINPALKDAIAASDCLILLGARFSENSSQGFSLLPMPEPDRALVHVHPGPEELGRIYRPSIPINATPGAFLAAMASTSPLGTPHWAGQASQFHAAYLNWSTPPKAPTTGVDMGAVMLHLRAHLPDDAIMTNGAGNYAIWLHRFHRYRQFGTQVAPTSGSMGYGLPAGVASALRHPDRTVVTFAGDGCFQMTGQELTTAVQYGLKLIVLVVDNGGYGTIRMHQERDYPNRISGTELVNPDFAALARACGAAGFTVSRTDDFPAAFEAGRATDGPALIHIRTDMDTIAPGRTLADLRG